MTLPKPARIALLGIGLYALCVLLLRFGRSGMEWDEALLIALVTAPVLAGWSLVRGRMNNRAREAGEGMRARRRARRAQHTD